MKPYIQTKYILSITPKEGKHYNPNHKEWHGKEAGIIDLPIGERGWLFYKNESDNEYFYNIPWHRIHLLHGYHLRNSLPVHRVLRRNGCFASPLYWRDTSS